MFDDLFVKKEKKHPKQSEKITYNLIKDEGFSHWVQCNSCGRQFETDASGMNCVLNTGTGPTGRGRTLEPACPWCEPHVPGRH